MDELIIHRCDFRIENNTKLWICHNEKNDKSWNCPFSFHCHTNTWILGMKIVLLLEEVRIRCAGGSFQKIDKHHQHFGLNTSKNLNFRCQLLRFRIYRRIQITFSNYHHFGTFEPWQVSKIMWIFFSLYRSGHVLGSISSAWLLYRWINKQTCLVLQNYVGLQHYAKIIGLLAFTVLLAPSCLGIVKYL